METTKLGISVGLMAAGLYFVGLFNFLALLVASGYILLFETNQQLKRYAVKALCIVVGFALLSQVISLGSYLSNILSNAFVWPDLVSFSWLNRIVSILTGALRIVEVIVLLFLGFKALVHGDVKVSGIDDTIDKHL